LKKKALLCACRIVRKVPDLVDNFLETSQKLLLGEKNHGVVLSASALVIEMCRNNRRALEMYQKHTGAVVRMLKTLVVSGYSPEHDVSGISDPFLQVQIIRLLRVLGKNDADASDKMNDILAQVATNTETSKNVGNAILYETVLTIMDIKSESGLRVLAVNILGRFLLHSDKNIRYVALNSLLQCVYTDSQAVQRHRATILDCLKDPDSSILRRAMELCFALMNPTTVRGTTRELLLFMETCPSEFKGDCASGLTMTAEKYSPNARWHVETLFKVLVVGGNYIRDDTLVASLVQRVSSHPEIQPYAVRALYRAVCERSTHQPLAQAACWCMGEFGQFLLENDESHEHVAIDEQKLVHTIEKLLETRLSNDNTRQYAINALVKLSTRLNPSTTAVIRDILLRYGSSLDVELQQRALEYSVIFTKYDNMRGGLLEAMPAYEKDLDGEVSEMPTSQDQGPDLLDIGGGEEEKPQETNENLLANLLLDETPAAVSQKQESSNSALEDILSMGNTSAPPAPASTSNDLGDLLGISSSETTTVEPPPIAEQAPEVSTINAYSEDGISVELSYSREPGTTVARFEATISSTNAEEFDDFTFQVAVPKTQQLQMLAPSSSTLSITEKVTQVFRVNNPEQTTVRLRLRIVYKLEGQEVVKMGEAQNIPDSWK